MGEKNLWSKMGLIVLLVGLSLWQIHPWKQQLKPGIDLGGGYSAVFEIDDSQDRSPDLAERVMTVLKQRVDPQGNRNLVWRPIGRNRLEIQMPAARGEDRTIREAYDKLRNELLATNITEAQIRAALSLAPAQRDATFERMVGPVTSRGLLFKQLAAADDQYRRLAQPAETQPAGTQPAATQPAATAPAEDIGGVLEARNARIADLLKTNLSVPALVDRLELGKKSQVRQAEVARLKKDHPDLAGTIDKLVEAYDKWSQQKGVLDDPSDLLRLLRGAGVLEFRILAARDPNRPDMVRSTNPAYNEPVEKYVTQLDKRGPRPEAGDNYAWFRISKAEENNIATFPQYVVHEYLGTKYVLAHSTPDMGLLNDRSWSLKAAWPGRDENGRLAVHFELDTRGGEKFYQMTNQNIGQPLCIFLDNDAISAATIRSAISTNGQISGSFTPQEVQYIVNTLEAGALPAKLKEVPIQERNVGPSLGNTNIQRGMQAVIASFIAVVAFMAIYYAYNGAIADIALLMNLVITLGAMSFLQATFTLPGIAGLILTMGMAVDANVLIFERMREELQRGVSARMAVKLGYEKAFSAIFDGNVTTIITAVILGWIGSEEIKGFGLTLGLGLAISMFTALFVTRQYYNVMVPLTLNQDEVRRAWMLPAVLVVAGAVITGLGYLAASGAELNEATLYGLGRFVLVMGATAVVLMASLWAFRLAYRATGHQKANRLPMMKLMSAPKIDWIGKYRKFWTGSAVVIIAGLLFMAGVPKDQFMDIEFIGGTSVQVQLKDQHKNLTDEQLMDYLAGEKDSTAAGWLTRAAGQLRQVQVKSEGNGRYLVSRPEGITQPQMEALLLANPAVAGRIARNGIMPAPNGVYVQFGTTEAAAVADEATAQRLIREDAARYVEGSAAKMRNARVQSLKEEGQTSFDIITTETARTLVAEAVMASMGDILQVTQPIQATLVTDAERAPDGIFPIKRADAVLSDVIGGASRADIAGYKGGLVMVFDNLQPPVTEAEVNSRLKQMRLQPDFEETGWRTFQVVGLEAAKGADPTAQLYSRVAVAVVDPNLVYDEDKDNATWRTEVAGREKALAEAALASSRSLQRVTQFAPQVAAEAAQKAIIAIILSFIAIAGYLWVRFGSLDFGISGIIALYHDVAVALAALMACHYVQGTWLGDLLLLRDFKIDLNIIAALLTIVGYSINDTIVIFDRIRENRGRLGQISPQLVNDSLNQTLSRTVLTAFTVFLTVVIMYVAGGEGIHGFAFAMIIGSISGTYSTLAIATPMVMHPRAMWITTIFIAAVTMVGVTWNISYQPLRWGLVLIVVGLAVYGAYRQFTGIKEERMLTSGRQPATV